MPKKITNNTDARIHYTEEEWQLAWEFIKHNAPHETNIKTSSGGYKLTRKMLKKFLEENPDISNQYGITAEQIKHSFLLINEKTLAIKARGKVYTDSKGREYTEGILGGGLYGDVSPVKTRPITYEGIINTGDTTMALKSMHSNYERNSLHIEGLNEEVETLNKLGRDAILIAHNKHEGAQKFYIAQKLIQGTTLKDFWDRNKDTLNPEQKIAIVQKIIEAVQEYRSKGISHNDLNLFNIMIDVSSDHANKYGVTIIDFGHVDYGSYDITAMFRIMREMVYSLAPVIRGYNHGLLQRLEFQYNEALNELRQALVLSMSREKLKDFRSSEEVTRVRLRLEEIIATVYLEEVAKALKKMSASMSINAEGKIVYDEQFIIKISGYYNDNNHSIRSEAQRRLTKATASAKPHGFIGSIVSAAKRIYYNVVYFFQSLRFHNEKNLPILEEINRKEIKEIECNDENLKESIINSFLSREQDITNQFKLYENNPNYKEYSLEFLKVEIKKLKEDVKSFVEAVDVAKASEEYLIKRNTQLYSSKATWIRSKVYYRYEEQKGLADLNKILRRKADTTSKKFSKN